MEITEIKDIILLAMNNAENSNLLSKNDTNAVVELTREEALKMLGGFWFAIQDLEVNWKYKQILIKPLGIMCFWKED